MEKKIELLPPTMPNFISMKMPGGKKEDGLQNDFKISITELSAKEAEEYGELMKRSFIEHHKSKLTKQL